jgi:hypothetical protein
VRPILQLEKTIFWQEEFGYQLLAVADVACMIPGFAGVGVLLRECDNFGQRVIYIFSFAAEAAPGAGIQNLLRYSASRHPSNKIAIRSYPDDECAGLEKIRLNLFYRPAVSGVEALWAL